MGNKSRQPFYPRGQEWKLEQRAARLLKHLRLLDRIRSKESQARYERLRRGWRDTTLDIRGHHQPRRTQIAGRRRLGRPE